MGLSWIDDLVYIVWYTKYVLSTTFFDTGADSLQLVIKNTK